MAGYEMHEAASLGDYETLEEFLKTGKYDVNMRDPEWKNRTPLHWACQRGYVDSIRLLLDHQAKGTSRMDMGWTPAHCAAEAGKLQSLRALYAAGVSIDRPDKYGDTPRRLAVIYDNLECYKFLESVELERSMARQCQSTDEDSSDTDTYFSDDDGNEIVADNKERGADKWTKDNVTQKR